MIGRRVLPVLVGVGALSAAGCGEGEKKPPEKASAEPPTTKSVATVAGGPSAAPTTSVIHQGDPIPIRMGGAAMPMPRPVPIPSGSMSARTAAIAPPAAAAPGRASGGAAAAAPPPAPVDAVQIVHNHPPDQPCQPLTDAEIKKAFGDMN